MVWGCYRNKTRGGRQESNLLLDGGIYVGRRTSFAVTSPTVGIVPKVRRAFARAFQPLALSFMEEKKKYVSPFGTGKKRMKRFFKS